MHRIWMISIALFGLAATVSVIGVAAIASGRADDPTASLQAWGTVGAALVSFWLLIAAVVAGLSVRLQIRQEAGHHDEQIQELQATRRDSLRPIVRLEYAPVTERIEGLAGIKLGADDEVQLQFHNVGPGPGLNIRLDVWYIDPPERGEAAPTFGAIETIESTPGLLETPKRDPDAQAIEDVIEAGGRKRFSWASGADLSVTGAGRVMWAIRFDDVYGQKQTMRGSFAMVLI